jgi:hypothetical protein
LPCGFKGLLQQKEKLEWLDKRMKELFPAGYYHLVFTLPHELNLLCLQNRKVMYGLLNYYWSLCLF